MRIKAFGFAELSSSQPLVGPVEGSDGRLYGTTSAGGTNGFGSVYSLNRDGSGYTELYSFANPTRVDPSGLAEGSDGALYGTANEGGTNNTGSLYKLDKDGANFTFLHSFGNTTSDGGYPAAGIVITNGRLYGTTLSGGSNNSGTVYSVNQDGSDYRILKNFLNTDGNWPQKLLVGTDSVLYGITFFGGTSNLGTVFKLSTNGSGFRILRSFTGSNGDGGNPAGQLIEGTDGVLYGTTSNGGSNGLGTVLKILKDGTGYKVLHSFSLATGQAQHPRTSLVEGTNGALYGCTSAGVGLGTIFEINKDGTGYQEIWQFSAGPGGEFPVGIVQGDDGGLYGATGAGGLRNGGTVFVLAEDGSTFTALRSFSPSGGDGQYPQASLLGGSDGALYGTTAGGGTDDAGTVFKCNVDGSGYTVLRSFLKNGSDAQAPAGALIEGSDGILYGTTTKGGTNGSGTVFKLNKDGSEYAIVWNFNYQNGGAHFPAAALIEASDGAVYGTTAFGGSAGNGTVFKIQKDGSGYAIVRSFSASPPDGRNPYAPLIEGSDGALYGTALNGGSNNFGTVFKLNKDGSNYRVLHSFSDASGSWPEAGLIEGSDGILYGTTSSGGSNQFGFPGGTLYKINEDGTGFSVLRNFTGVNGDGYEPEAGLVEAADGSPYGTTANGGSDSSGTVFKMNKDGSGFQVVHSFLKLGGDGTEPQTSLAFGSDGSLFGTTLQGGDMNFGTLFKVRLHPVILIPPQGQLVTAGQDITLSVTASGSQLLFYQWQHDGTNVPGGTNATLLLVSVQGSDAGDYTVIVSNDLGTASATATLQVNYPPVADASATLRLILSPNGTNATVVLDGSRSFDPDGDPLQYLWFSTGLTNPIATGVVAIVVLPVGTNSITLAVSDPYITSTQTILVEVVTASEAVDSLVAAVNSDVSRSQSLAVSLEAAIASIDRSNPTAAINQLEAFQNKVQAQVAPLDPALAQTLIQAAQVVIDDLSNGTAGPVIRVGFDGLVRQSNGKMRLRFSGAPGKLYVIAGSTNLLDWELIGVGTELSSGSFEFEDGGAVGSSSRFYRLVLP